jgi:hypothetical protein
VPEAAFTGTIVSTYPDGRTARLQLEKNGAYKAWGRRGNPSGGRWSVKGDEICLKQTRPFTAPFSYCTAIREGGVGTRWAAKAVTGEPIQVELRAGR